MSKSSACDNFDAVTAPTLVGAFLCLVINVEFNGGIAVNNIFTLLRDLLIAEFAERGIAVQVVRSFGDIPAALEKEPLFVVQHMKAEREGWQARQVHRQAGEGGITELQTFAETLQISVRLPTTWPQEGKATMPEALDLLTTASMFMQSSRMVDAAKAVGMSVQAIKTLTSNYIQNEQQWENYPHCELVICHNLTLMQDVGVVEAFTSGIYSV